MNMLIKIILAILILFFLLVSSISFASALVIRSIDVADEIVPGETSRITITLRNDGNDDIEDVSVSLDLTEVPFAPFDSSSEYSIDEIREDKTKDAFFSIITLNNAQSGIYKIPLKITYIDLGDDQLKTKNSLISIVVNSEPIIDVNIEDSLLLKNQDNDLSIKITNKGLSNAKFLEVEIGNSRYVSILSQNRHYLGDIDSDDFDSIDIKVFINKNAPDKTTLPLTVIYRDDLNKEYIEDFEIPLTIYTKNKAIEVGLIERNNTIAYIVGGVIFVILIIVYRRLRKRAREKNLVK